MATKEITREEQNEKLKTSLLIGMISLEKSFPEFSHIQNDVKSYSEYVNSLVMENERDNFVSSFNEAVFNLTGCSHVFTESERLEKASAVMLDYIIVDFRERQGLPAIEKDERRW